MSYHHYYSGVKVTEMGFTPAKTKAGDSIWITTESGRTEQLQFGVSEYGVPGVVEFIRGENGMKSQKIGAHCILWLPDAKVNPTKKRLGGLTIDWQEYLKVVSAPENYPDQIAKLEQYHIPLDICMEN